MMSLGFTRFIIASLIAALAGLTALIVSPSSASLPAGPPTLKVDGPRPVLASDISALSARLRATGLFPAAIALEINQAGNDVFTAGKGDTSHSEDLSDLVKAPQITALVRQNKVWRLYAGGVISDRERLVEGDEIFDGWRVDQISATRVHLRREEEMQVINVFQTPEDN
jgi:hypothetical protein